MLSISYGGTSLLLAGAAEEEEELAALSYVKETDVMQALDLVKDFSASIYRTDIQGDVFCMSDGKEVVFLGEPWYIGKREPSQPCHCIFGWTYHYSKENKGTVKDI